MRYHLADSLVQLFAELNLLAPNRSTVSDGWIGDPAHQARYSDHNPDVDGSVNAIDITHDPAGRMDCGELAEYLRLRCIGGLETRVAYLIFNRRISSRIDNWTWRDYRGENPHDKHLHISIHHTSAAETSTVDWLPDYLEDVMTDDDWIRLEEMVRAIVREEAPKSVWDYPIHNLNTADPHDKRPARTVVGYAARWAYQGISCNNKCCK